MSVTLLICITYKDISIYIYTPKKNKKQKNYRNVYIIVYVKGWLGW